MSPEVASVQRGSQASTVEGSDVVQSTAEETANRSDSDTPASPAAAGADQGASSGGTVGQAAEQQSGQVDAAQQSEASAGSTAGSTSGSTASSTAPQTPASSSNPQFAPGGLATCRSAPPLPAPSGNVVRVQTEAELQNAVNNLSPGTTILIAPGIYRLSSTLVVRTNNVTIRGDSNDCNAVVLQGRGMDNANYGDVPHGIFTTATGLSVQNLTITEVYFHGVALNAGAQSPKFYNCLLYTSPSPRDATLSRMPSSA